MSKKLLDLDGLRYFYGKILARMGNLSNPALNQNPDFQIWQRGTSFDTGIGTALGCRSYTVDRWQVGSDTGKVRITKENGLKAVFLANGNFLCSQPNLVGEMNLRGKKVTVSAKVVSSKPLYLHIYGSVDGSGYTDLGVATIVQNDITKVTATIPTNITKIRVEINGDGFITNDTVNIQYVKLELGEIATPLSPRPYGEELALCQRYFQTRSTNNVPAVDMRPLMRIASPTVGGTSGAYTYDAEIY